MTEANDNAAAATATTGILMKRTTSEKSLPNSTGTTSSSSSSSSSISSASASVGGPRRQQSAPFLLAASNVAGGVTASNSSLESLKSASASSTQSQQISPVSSTSSHHQFNNHNHLYQPYQQKQQLMSSTQPIHGAISSHQQNHLSATLPPAAGTSTTAHKSVTWSLDRNSVEIIEYDNENEQPESDVAQPNQIMSSNRQHTQSALTNQPPQPASQPAPPVVEFAVATLSGVERRLRVLQTRRFDDGHYDKLLEDGTLLTIFSNGTIKEIR